MSLHNLLLHFSRPKVIPSDYSCLPGHHLLIVAQFLCELLVSTLGAAPFDNNSFLVYFALPFSRPVATPAYRFRLWLFTDGLFSVNDLGITLILNLSSVLLARWGFPLTFTGTCSPSSLGRFCNCSASSFARSSLHR